MQSRVCSLGLGNKKRNSCIWPQQPPAKCRGPSWWRDSSGSCLFCDEGPCGERLQVGRPWRYKSSIVGSHRVKVRSITPQASCMHAAQSEGLQPDQQSRCVLILIRVYFISKWEDIFRPKCKLQLPIQIKSHLVLNNTGAVFCDILSIPFGNNPFLNNQLFN